MRFDVKLIDWRVLCGGVPKLRQGGCVLVEGADSTLVLLESINRRDWPSVRVNLYLKSGELKNN